MRCALRFAALATTTSVLVNLPVQAQDKEPPKHFTSAIGMKFVWIPPGAFTMGSPMQEEGRRRDETQHPVTLTKGFYLGVHAVTQEQWQAIMGQNHSHHKGPKSLPVDSVSWDDCQVFLEKLRKNEGRLYRLPTEAEFEYACRAGSKAAYSHGDDRKLLDQYAWHEWNSGGNTHAVGQKKPNAWGLFDMHGNLWQWCASSYAEYPQHEVIDPNSRFFEPARVADLIKQLGSPNYAERLAATKALKEIGPPALSALWRVAVATGLTDLETQRRAVQLIRTISERGKYLVLRGGSFSVLPWTARCACRNYNEPSIRNENYGVRVAMTSREE
jgi:formylglycine-generating enzyme required for sulfatase activity